MDGCDPFDRLDLDHEAALHDEIRLIATVQFYAFIEKRKFLLPGVSNTGLTKFKAQALLIGAFQQSRPKMPMHLDGEANNLPRRIRALKVIQETFTIFVTLW
jgi:hypothetical protein